MEARLGSAQGVTNRTTTEVDSAYAPVPLHGAECRGEDVRNDWGDGALEDVVVEGQWRSEVRRDERSTLALILSEDAR